MTLSHSVLNVIGDILSLITIGICSVQKLPQIINIFRVKNALGMNLISLLMELVSYSITMSYNYRYEHYILTYLEYPLILAQQMILIATVLYYSERFNAKSMAWSGLYFSILLAFLTGLFPRELLMFLVPLCTPIGASAKVVQLVEILTTQNSDSISLVTWFISAFTNCTRIFTVLIDSADVTLLLNFVVNTALSSAVLLAAMHYKRKPRKE